MTDIAAPATAPRRFETPALGALFALSGAAALIYQVLWVRELGLLFGSTAQAAALTIAIFFAGIALGGWLFGRISARLERVAAFLIQDSHERRSVIPCL